MKISVKRTGGFAGLTENVTDLDTSQLDSGKAEKIAAKIRKIGFFDYPAVVAAGAVGADMYQYEIKVTDGPKHHSVTFSEGSPKTAPLVDLVETLEHLK